ETSLAGDVTMAMKHEVAKADGPAKQLMAKRELTCERPAHAHRKPLDERLHWQRKQVMVDQDGAQCVRRRAQQQTDNLIDQMRSQLAVSGQKGLIVRAGRVDFHQV